MCLDMLIISALYTVLSPPGRCNLLTLQDFLPLFLSLASAWKPMKSQWKLLLYGKELVRSHLDHGTTMTRLTLRFTCCQISIHKDTLYPGES